MRLQHGTVVVLAAAALVLGACSNDDKDSSSATTSSTTTTSQSSSSAASTTAATGDDDPLAVYVGELCGIQQGFIQDAQEANTKLGDPSTGPEEAAAIISDLATSFGGAGLAIAELGDPPNGEGAGLTEAANEVFATAADGFESIASQVSDGTLTDSESTAAALQPVTDQFQQDLQALTTEYPTPELDALQQSTPGCTGS